ncbi:hypothetical protein CIN_01550 [Commensalibacter intestini A911]|uniref:DUF707 domain-containing protein n=1 Tax=Commensalibacter intestini A911 TaxID=1088868 RepID=G6EXI5_9PROT|nr:hypothetical protein [Commensalibacter intestini]EHD14223.1 hypothetical protein CIN_01550 [Commensalibacter intestini A911]
MKHLMILRCGKNSIHKSWIHYIRNIMDIAFVYYDDSNFSDDMPTYSCKYEGTKLTGVHDFVINHPDIINQYDFFWLFEDDLYITYQSAQGIINFINTFKPSLSAPSLTHESFFSHPITLQCNPLLLRGCDYVECMSPIMSQAFLINTIEQFMDFPIWGIEKYWKHLLWEMQEVAFIYDKWPITHTRRMGAGSLYTVAAERKIDFLKDDARASELYSNKFGSTLTNILFGIEELIPPTLLTTSKLRETITPTRKNLETMYGSYGITTFGSILNSTNYHNTLFSQFLAFPKLKKLLFQEASPQVSNILTRDWLFGDYKENSVWCHNMRFSLDGYVMNYHHPNEYYWKIIDGNFVLLSKDNEITTVFNKQEVVDGKILLTGLHAHSTDNILYLREGHH